VLPLHNQSEEIRDDIVSGELMSDEEIALYFLKSPKINLPSRLGALKLLLNFKVIETPLGLKAFLPFSDAEKINLEAKYDPRSTPLLSACIVERRIYASSLIDLLNKAILEAADSHQELNAFLRFKPRASLEQQEFLDYFSTLKELRKKAFTILEICSDLKKANYVLKKELEAKKTNFIKKIKPIIEMLPSTKPAVFSKVLKQMTEAVPSVRSTINAQISDFNSAQNPQEKLLKQKAICTTVLNEISKLTSSQSFYTQEQNTFLDAMIALTRDSHSKSMTSAFEFEMLKNQ
jgi:hypothetical protein